MYVDKRDDEIIIAYSDFVLCICITYEEGFCRTPGHPI